MAFHRCETNQIKKEINASEKVLREKIHYWKAPYRKVKSARNDLKWQFALTALEAL